jgi:hypothetical protein
VFQLAAGWQAAGDARHLKTLGLEPFADVMRRGLALDSEVGGQDDLLGDTVLGALEQLSRPISFGPRPSSGDSRPISTKYRPL